MENVHVKEVPKNEGIISFDDFMLLFQSNYKTQLIITFHAMLFLRHFLNP